MDFAKAFNKVPHLRLAYKLEYYGFRNDILSGRPISISPRVVSPPSRFAHFYVRPWVVSPTFLFAPELFRPPFKILYLVVLFRSQKWYEALIFLFIGDFTL